VNIALLTPRLLLREISVKEDDLDSYLNWLRDVESNSFIISARADYGLAELVEFIESTNLDVNALLFGIFLREDQKFIGTLKVQPIDFLEGTSWLGIMIGSPEFRGHGYGREALLEVMEFLLNSLKLREIFLGVDLKNIDAISLYRNLGFSEYKIEENSMVMVKRNLPNFK
jgi:ribosomal-protein-alanine N-acetyltransferase